MAAAVSQVEASEPTVKALLSEATRANYLPPIALGVSAPARWSGAASFAHEGRQVRVVPCVSALAARQALLQRNADDWLVIVTDRPGDDLGDGILAHLAWQRLRNPDAWNAVLESFGAQRFDPALEARGRALADGLLLMTPGDVGWPAAPAGMLTRDHAMGAVAAVLFDRDGERVVTDLDLDRLLRWSTSPGASDTVRAARAHHGEVLFTAVADWLAEQCGDVRPVVRTLLANHRVADLVPLGLATQAILSSSPDSGPRVLLDQIVGDVPEPALTAWAQASARVARAALARRSDADMPRVLARAEALLVELKATGLADASDVLPRSLTTRLSALGDTLRHAAAGADDSSSHGAADDRVAAVEAAWAKVLDHALADRDDDRSVAGAHAGVRLTRWLAEAAPAAPDLATAMARFRDDDAWADRAVIGAWNATEIPELRTGLNAVLAVVRQRRDTADKVFASRLAAATGTESPAPEGALFMEDVLTGVVGQLPTPVLLIVADGMSLANATQIVDGLTVASGWWECVRGGRRLLSIGALPTVTRVCRTSLFCGHIAEGDQATERSGFEAWGKAHQRPHVKLFHKLALDSSSAGSALADDVRAAIDDITGLQIVACVVNTIDDALDRSDPGGTDWTADSVKHLRPLLDRARQAGRTVVLTSDHGHIIERRQGTMAPGKLSNSNRWRPANGASATSQEVLVQGRRVVADGNKVVLAVDEQLRYSALKAGYHGGGAPAEVVVPVIVLSPGPAPAGWELAPPQAPAWWREPIGHVTPTVSEPAPVPRRTRSSSKSIQLVEGDGLFEVELPAHAPAILFTSPKDVVPALTSSTVWKDRAKRIVRRAVTDQQILALVTALTLVPDHRMTEDSAAAALGVASVQLPGAFSQVQRLLNVEQYPVITRSEGFVVLDLDLLREQFELAS